MNVHRNPPSLGGPNTSIAGASSGGNAAL
ncbi:uncharacterized protein FFB14_15138 [Fusarium fujikuroi]|nr:uncharacterized protein FFB14_15138 [Fusarium fujikuroi]